ncbi:unnamed protein product, partial [Linum tenue]
LISEENELETTEHNHELQPLNEREERKNQHNKATEEQQVLTNQLTSANSRIQCLGNELTKERKAIEELKKHQIQGLEDSLSKAGHQKNALEQEPKGKLSSAEGLLEKIGQPNLELKLKEEMAPNLTSSLKERESSFKNLTNAYKQVEKDFSRAHTEVSGLKYELLETKQQLELKYGLLDMLELEVSSETLESDESKKKLVGIQEEYHDLKSFTANKAALDAKLLGEREEEIKRLTLSLALSINEANGEEKKIADLNHEREELKRLLEAESSRTKNLKHQLFTTQEAIAKSRNEASGLETLLRHSRASCTKLEDGEYAAAAESFQKSIETLKESCEILAHELTSARGQLMKKRTEEFKSVTTKLAAAREDHDNLHNVLADVYKKAEANAKGLIEKEISRVVAEKEMLNKSVAEQKKAVVEVREHRRCY